VRRCAGNSSTPFWKRRRFLASFYFDNFFSAFGEAEQTGLLTREFAGQFAPSTAYKSVLDYWEHSSGEMLQRLLYTDIKTYLVELLMKQDNMSMAASIESRVPFSIMYWWSMQPVSRAKCRSKGSPARQS